MAEVHILTTGGRHMKLVCHIPVPAGNNSASVSWQTALINSGLGGKTELKDGNGSDGTIDSTEKTAIVTTGSIFERAVSVDMGVDFDGLSAANKNARVDAAYNAAKAEAQAYLQAQLKYFGYTREVP